MIILFCLFFIFYAWDSIIIDVVFLISGSSLVLINLIVFIVNMCMVSRGKFRLALITVIYIVFLALGYYFIYSIGGAIAGLGGTI